MSTPLSTHRNILYAAINEHLTIDQSLEVRRDARCQRWVSNEKTKLDVPIEGGLREVRRGDEDRLVTRHDRLRVKDTCRAREIERSGVVEDPRPRRARPIGTPEAIRELPH